MSTPELTADICAYCAGPVDDDDLCTVCARFVCVHCDDVSVPANQTYVCDNCRYKTTNTKKEPTK